jgi:2-amino-4-hydroxy-6-hydroxymethyldihydropteridine diphosphokinase
VVWVAIARAIQRLRPSLGELTISPLYETAPMYVEDQPPFFNGALVAQTDLGPLTLLRLLKQTESAVGRSVGERNGPREIDLDLVLYGSLKLESRGGEHALLVPHPRLPERRFVLQPLFDLKPDLMVVGAGTVAQLLSATEHQASTVRRYSDGVL